MKLFRMGMLDGDFVIQSANVVKETDTHYWLDRPLLLMVRYPKNSDLFGTDEASARAAFVRLLRANAAEIKDALYIADKWVELAESIVLDVYEADPPSEVVICE